MKYWLTILLLILVKPVFSQGVLQGHIMVKITLPSLALVDIEPNNGNIHLSLTAPTQAGSQMATTATDNSKWLNFTSAVKKNVSRKITVELIGAIPDGMNLKLSAASYSGFGAGALGSSSGIINMTNSPQTLIDDIGGAYTGNGQNNGYNLTYSLEITSYQDLESQTATIPVMYTLMDN